MPTRPRREPGHAAFLLLVAVAATGVLVAVGGPSGARGTAPATRANWTGLAGEARPRVALGQRTIVLLKAPSLADRVARAGGLASGSQEQRWTKSVTSQQKLLIARLAAQGVQIAPEFSYTRVLDGFSAPLDASAIALLERAPEVAGLYPVRPAYPAGLGSDVLQQRRFGPGTGHRPGVRLPGVSGRGVTVAVLDTGIDRAQPFLRGRVIGAADVVGGDDLAQAAANPDDAGQLERHGTEVAGLIVGAGGPDGLAGIAPDASIFPVRVAGWQRDATGAYSVYGRTDQLLAGLELAVDPNEDGDAHDAARVALVGIAEPFAAFADGPSAKAAAGALALDTLVVAPVGNDGPGGPTFGSVSGPGGAPSVLTVGAVDLRRREDTVRAVLRSSLDVLVNRRLPLGGAVGPAKPLHAEVVAPRLPPADAARAGRTASSFFDRRGFSLVAGRAALVPAGSDPEDVVRAAAVAGARAVLVYGSSLPAGGFGLEEDVAAPVVALPEAAARKVLGELAAGHRVDLTLGHLRRISNPTRGGVAAFSSTGLAFDGRVKPELVATGVELSTSDPGVGDGGAPRYGTINGSSAAAAVVAGAAALLAEARPSVDAAGLKSLLVGAARPIDGESVTSQGAGLLDLGAATASELGAEPTTLALGRASGQAWRVRRELLVRNLSTRRVAVRISIARSAEGAAAIRFTARPSHVLLQPGEILRVRLRAEVTSVPRGTEPAEGAVVITPSAGRAIRVPWAIAFDAPRSNLLTAVGLSERSFTPSDTRPAILTFTAGAVGQLDRGGARRTEIAPVSLLDVVLWTEDGHRIGVLARLRDLLPGRYQLGLTGRDPVGATLPAGGYAIRLVAHSTLGGPATRGVVRYEIR